MPNVRMLCTKCNYEFPANIRNIDAFKRGFRHTSPSCPICRRKKWLRLVKK